MIQKVLVFIKKNKQECSGYCTAKTFVFHCIKITVNSVAYFSACSAVATGNKEMLVHQSTHGLGCPCTSLHTG